MGIDAHMGIAFHGKSQNCRENTAAAVGSHPMDGSIGALVQPLPIFNVSIGGIRLSKIGKDTVNVFILHHIEIPCRNILFQHIQGRIIGSPLGGIAGFCHEFPGKGIDFQDPVKILPLCLSNRIHKITSFGFCHYTLSAWKTQPRE